MAETKHYKIVIEMDAWQETPEDAALWTYKVLRSPDCLPWFVTTIDDNGVETNVDLWLILHPEE